MTCLWRTSWWHRASLEEQRLLLLLPALCSETHRCPQAVWSHCSGQDGRWLSVFSKQRRCNWLNQGTGFHLFLSWLHFGQDKMLCNFSSPLYREPNVPLPWTSFGPVYLRWQGLQVVWYRQTANVKSQFCCSCGKGCLKIAAVFKQQQENI